MIAALALGAALASEPVGLVLAARPLWDPDCVQAQGWQTACQSELLQYTDDDAWRVGLVLEAALGAERVKVLAQPDASTDGLLSSHCPEDRVTADCALAAAAELAAGEPVDLSLYISAHGTPEGVHLDDRIHPLSELLDRIRAALPPGSSLQALFGDACSSARWRGDRPQRVIARPARDVELEVLVDQGATELSSARGGTLTRLLLSAQAGGADLNRDQVIHAQELANFLDVHASRLGEPITPTVRARDVLQPVDALQPGAEGATLVLGHLHGVESAQVRTRWLVHRVVEQAEGRSTEHPFYDVSSLRDRPIRLQLPPGRWRVWAVPYSTLNDYSSRHLGRVWGQERDVELAAGDTLRLEPDESWHRWPVSSGGVHMRGEAPANRAEVVSQLIADTAFRLPEAPNQLSHRYFGGRRTWLMAGAALSTPVLGRRSPLTGGSLGLLWAEREGHAMLVGGLYGAPEIGDAEPQRLGLGGLQLGYDRTLIAGARGRLGLVGLLALELAGLPQSEPSQVSPAVGADLGPTVGLQLGRWMLRLEGPLWSNRVALVAGASSRWTTRPEVQRLSARLSLGAHL